jgi:selenocysteine lyase/cysteine desulfurase
MGFFEWLPQRERLRKKLGQLVGAQGDDIALTSGTTRGIADIALSLDWRPGDRVLLFEGEFPANVTPWQRAAELFGLELSFVPMAHAVEDEDAFITPLTRQLERGARLVAVSAVQFQTGLRMPLSRIAELCKRHGAELCVDAIQACGVLPLDVQALGLDYLVCGSHKWLLGLEGVGFLYAPSERAKALVPRTAGWLSHEDGTRFLFAGPGELRYDRPFKQSVQVFEGSSSSGVGFAAFEAAVDPLLELGPEAISAHVARYLDQLEPQLVARGFVSRRAAEAGRRSGILSLRPPAGLTAPELVGELHQRGVIASMPDGLLRFAPHFPNAMSEIETVVAAVDEATAALRKR